MVTTEQTRDHCVKSVIKSLSHQTQSLQNNLSNIFQNLNYLA